MHRIEQAPAFGFESDKPQEACGVVGFVPKNEDALSLASVGVISMHNRGEDGTGIAAFTPELRIIKNLGKSDRAFKGGTLLENLGYSAVSLGHVHYSTDEANETRSLQPYGDDEFAYAHNGQFTNARAIAKRANVPVNGESDSEVVYKLIQKTRKDLGSTELALEELLPKLAGAFSIAIAEKDRLIAARDRRGWRPLNLGRLADGGYGVSSESAVFDLIGGDLISAVQPGTYSVLTKDKIETYRWASPQLATCGLEYAYFSRADSEIDGVEVAKSRFRMGRLLGEDYPLDVDVVIPMPNSGRHAATGYANQTGIRHADGFYRNDDLGRIYIKSKSRSMLARLKNNPIESVVNGFKIAVVDDSAIRGSTAREAISSLREKGAKEVHWLSAFPKVISDCYYGMNMRQRDGLIALGENNEVIPSEEIAGEIGADSINYLSVARFQQAVERVGSLCMACTTGEYPEPIEQEMIEKERIPS